MFLLFAVSFTTGASVIFDQNLLTALDEDVFKPIVDAFMSINFQGNNFVSVAKSN